MHRWVTIRGFERYQVNSLGEIRRTADFKPVTQTDNGSVVMVRFPGGKRQVCKTVAHLVAAAFIKNPHNKPFVWHKNGIYTDNRASNLEWVSKAEHHHRTGINNARRKPVIKITTSGEIVDAYGSITEAAKKNYLSAANVRKRCLRIVKARYDNHGCTFAFEH